ncbi:MULTISPECIES: fimbrial protein [Pseudomonas]|uniref:Fimbrial protein n=1 Tax=Pseudomonas juntendi TaxID=2666183 RepID=A0A7W2Q8B4_9PSED|nr:MULTISPECIES: fimbrial protein [Pseudomonas]MBA6097002.1 fimbrial protein [Pseudomonas juntendi]
MKRLFAILTLGMIGSSAMANNGIINFEGTVSAGGTCPIDLVTPGGPSLPKVFLGDFRSENFTAIGQQTEMVRFALRVDPTTCTIAAGQKAFVKFAAHYGTDPSGRLYGLQSGVGYSDGMALAIYDKSNAELAPDAESVEYELSDSVPTDMNFTARLETVKANVTEGQLRGSATFTVDIR